MLKKLVKNEKGLTLVELLAVIVILGIIAAIAVPSIGAIIDNSKKDAHIANAQQMVSGAKIAVTGNSELLPSNEGGESYLPLEYLINQGYLDKFTDPDGGEYIVGENLDQIPASQPTTSYVRITKDGNTYIYSVFLAGSERSVGSAGDPIASNDLTRDVIADK
ncbi:competence type IV pilus major pilin ComGC [Fredinandcohnia quinoae]|uniref:Type II secretion system GspH family protein n=1 Tax=Fredinandcohnia quinoae TaxID=2918902 RepID=A0AAW5EBN1_9BACI|nr:type II secretion system protein [Fredinandcohnia sp. SECRCQ15]MCH1626583.1 type II secretion system GspH family protein [Fredinandcohnia sp. SECRCQ15]